MDAYDNDRSLVLLNNKPPVPDIISRTFPAFDHHGTITVPFENESKRDVEFEESECMRLCDLIQLSDIFLQS